ncbi:substrate-specific activator of APC-dependent proteolysis [Ascosphaera pollenicola]|nr:substrate-specific activator of APC-dependent proteolysis [Ascosphaera pollenicola]
MSTISSPRMSMASIRSPTPGSLPRPSSDALRATSPSASIRTASPSVAQRRNRVALRDYYNLQAARGPSSQIDRTTSTTRPSDVSAPTDLDNPDFNAEAYVAHLLATSSLSTIIKAESSLITDVRSLDGERKALVYDNYSKLIKAVETIGKMRSSQPTTVTSTLGPAVDYVTETAMNLVLPLLAKQDDAASRQRETVRWVLGTPARLEALIAAGEQQGAEEDWKEIKDLLDKWKDVKGVEELKARCEGIMSESKPEESTSKDDE